MSTPTTLVLPPGVSKAYQSGVEGDISMLSIQASGPEGPHRSRGHILLIPGWTGSKEDFIPVMPLLAAAGYDVDAYDQPGQYESDPATDYSLERFAREALWLSTTAGGASHILGHSFGGLVAQKAAVLDPSQVASLSLLCTGPGALGETPGRPPLAPLVQAIGPMSLAEIRARMPRDPSLPADIAEFLDTRFTSNDPASLKAITQLLNDAPDIIDDVAATGLPFWVGRGADDDAWPHDVQESMAKRLDTEIHVVEDSAHSPAVENPQGLIDAWLPFLLEHSPKEHS
jgi:pimeloyl-ACP methyl ester carboxylesterase